MILRLQNVYDKVTMIDQLPMIVESVIMLGCAITVMI